MSRLRPLAPYLVLAAYLAALLAFSWERWGNPVIDPGLDLTVAANWLHGVMPYRDVRYWYGPLGVAGLSGMFAIFGTSLWTAYAFGLAQTALIAELSRRIARRWLPHPLPLVVVAVVMSIGFSGSLFNFQLPHTESATAGLIALLVVILSITNGRYLVAGLAVGAAALTRPEFLAFCVAAAGGMALGQLRAAGWRSALGQLVPMIVAALVVAVPGLGFFAAKAGTHRFLFENVFPTEFLKVSATFEHDWHPYDLPSLGTLLLRGVVVAGGAWAVLRALEAWGYTRGTGIPGARRLRIVAAPVASFVVVLAAVAFVSIVFGVVGGSATGSLHDVASDTGRLLIPMTALPAIGFAALLVAAWGWLRGGPAPLSGGLGEAGSAGGLAEPAGSDPAADPRGLGPGWAADGALIAVAAACGLRTYAAFSTDDYSTYYAPPLVLLASILLYRAALRIGPARVKVATGGILAMAAAAMSAHAIGGLYLDDTFKVTTPHGSFRTTALAGPNVQKVVDLIKPHVKPQQPLMEIPQEPGFQFFLGTRPAIYDVTLLPGTLATAAEDEAAATALLRANPRFVIIASRSLKQWGYEQSGVDVNVRLTQAVTRNYRVLARAGDVTRPSPSDLPPSAFTVYERLPGNAGAGTASQSGVLVAP